MCEIFFSGFYRFVRPAHKERFNKTCKELTGQGCVPADGSTESSEAKVAPSGASKRQTEQKDLKLGMFRMICILIYNAF